MIYEGSDVPLPDNKYSFSIEQNDDDVVHSGSVVISSEGNSPNLTYRVGDKFNIPGIGKVTCTKISAVDDYSDTGAHLWTITYEGSDKQDDSGQQAETLPKVKYSFSIDKDGTSSVRSGNMQVVNAGDAPIFSLNIGEEFSFPGIGNLTCINISGNDEYTDKGSRIWTITYEGAIVLPQQAKYSLSLNKDNDAVTASGSIQVINDGDAPAFVYGIGNTIYIPGLGEITCVGISASDEISESGVRRWTVTYEGANEQTQDTKYSFTIDRNGKSYSMQVINVGDTPALNLSVGSSFFVPGLGRVVCSSISANDEYSESGARIWTVTYEGNDALSAQSQLAKYSLNIDKYGDSSIKTGSMQIFNEGNDPNLSIEVGKTFTIPGLGKVTCTGISANNEYSENGVRGWNVTYESNDDQQAQLQSTSYSFIIRKDNASSFRSGSMQVINVGDSPTLSIEVGETFTIPGLGKVTCTNISVSDSYSEGGSHVWTVTYEGNNEYTQDTTYSFSIDRNSGSPAVSASMQVTNVGDSPTLSIEVGETFTIPGLGKVTCTNISVSDSYSEGGSHVWTVTYEGNPNSSSSGSSDSGSGSSSTSSNETSISYELNGSTVRTVKGELIVLRRSSTPITKKTITVFNDSDGKTTTIGSEYEGGIVLSENIIKETITNNGVVTGSHYKHTIEVEL